MRKIHDLPGQRQKRKTLRNSTTPHEIILWSRLKRNQLRYKFRRQYSIGKYIIDFYCPEKKLIIEIDGSQHINNIYDIERTGYFNKLGFKVSRFWDNEINNNLDGVLLAILEGLK